MAPDSGAIFLCILRAGFRSVVSSLAEFRGDCLYYSVHNTVPPLVHKCDLVFNTNNKGRLGGVVNDEVRFI
jgi:hypothetical protein